MLGPRQIRRTDAWSGEFASRSNYVTNVILMTFLKIFGTVLLTLLAFGCGTETPKNNPSNSPASSSSVSVEPAAPRVPKVIDVTKLADKSSADFDAAFGQADETKPIENGGEYRLYKVNGHSRGLAVRFYGGRAKEFNLILDRPIPTAKEALKVVFGIDVGSAKAVNEPKEPLSETYRGTFGGVRFTKASAKKQENGNGFIFVLAQVAR
jgi:hypothetical protein